MSEYVISVTLIFNSRDNFLWTNTKVNKIGLKEKASFRKKVENRVHLVSVNTHETLCGRYRLDKTTRSRVSKNMQWGSEMTALSLITSVEVRGSASYCDSTNVTFLKLCRKCMAEASPLVHISLDIGTDKNNLWNPTKTIVERANEFDIEKWKEYNINA